MSEKITETQVQLAISLILADKTSYSTSLNYAVAYCKAAEFLHGHDLGVQCLYILNNISHWRNQHAKEVRATLKQYAKENK